MQRISLNSSHQIPGDSPPDNREDEAPNTRPVLDIPAPLRRSARLPSGGASQARNREALPAWPYQSGGAQSKRKAPTVPASDRKTLRTTGTDNGPAFGIAPLPRGEPRLTLLANPGFARPSRIAAHAAARGPEHVGMAEAEAIDSAIAPIQPTSFSGLGTRLADDRSISKQVLGRLAIRDKNDPELVHRFYAKRNPDGSLDQTQCDENTSFVTVNWSVEFREFLRQRRPDDADEILRRLSGQVQAEYEAAIHNEIPESLERLDPVKLRREHCQSDLQWQHLEGSWGVKLSNYESQLSWSFVAPCAGPELGPLRRGVRAYEARFGKRAFSDFALECKTKTTGEEVRYIALWGAGIAQFFNGAAPDELPHVAFANGEIVLRDPDGVEHSHWRPSAVQIREVPPGEQALADYGPAYFADRGFLTVPPSISEVDEPDEAWIKAVKALPRLSVSSSDIHERCIERLHGLYTDGGTVPLSDINDLKLRGAAFFLSQLERSGHSIGIWAEEKSQKGAVPFHHQFSFRIPPLIMRETVEVATSGRITVKGRERTLAVKGNETDIRSFDPGYQRKTTFSQQSHLRQIAAWLEGEPDQGTNSLREWVDVDAQTWKSKRLPDLRKRFDRTTYNSYSSVLSRFRQSVRGHEDPVAPDVDRSPAYLRLLGREEIDLQPCAAKIPSFDAVADPEDRAYLIELRIHLGLQRGSARKEIETRKFLGAAGGFLRELRTKKGLSLDEWVKDHDVQGPDRERRRLDLQKASHEVATYKSLLRPLLELAMARRDDPELARNRAKDALVAHEA